MERIAHILAAGVIAATAPAHAATAGDVVCKLCPEAREEAKERTPIAVSVESGLSFSRLALSRRGEGEVEIDPVTGRKIVHSNILDLGGVSFSGRARIMGEPLQPVRVDMPGSITLHAPGGGEAELSDFVTDLPKTPVLDANGSLEFSFGGRLRTRDSGTGNFRGRIPIRVEYN